MEGGKKKIWEEFEKVFQTCTGAWPYTKLPNLLCGGVGRKI
jgi:hypothetical protein